MSLEKQVSRIKKKNETEMQIFPGFQFFKSDDGSGR